MTPSEVTVHRHAPVPGGMDVNAYLVETAGGVIAVDSTLTVSDSRALRSHMLALKKPLLAVLITHPHPDHYGGVTEFVASEDVPIIATAGVDQIIRRDDAVKERILRPMFGDEWPLKRTFPNQTVSDGERVSFDGVTFTALDLGPGESPHDSVWVLDDDRRVVFLGDEMYGRKHCYLADGYHEQWLAILERLRSEFPEDATLHLGHGEPADRTLIDWQVGYIRTFIDAIRAAAWSSPDQAKAAVVAAMKAYLPCDDLQFLMELSIEPMAQKLGLVGAPA